MTAIDDYLRLVIRAQIEADRAEARQEVRYWGDGVYTRGLDSIALEGAEEIVLEGLIDLRAATENTLTAATGYKVTVVPVLRRIRPKFPLLRAAIVLPGGKGRGGYHVRLRDMREASEPVSESATIEDDQG